MKKLFLFLLLVFVSGCLNTNADKITQISTIDALLAGSYDGQMRCSELSDYGDFGIGTFDRLDGEMVVSGGRVYQVKADGKVYRPSPKMTTPFASVCKFRPEIKFDINTANYDKVKSYIDENVPNKNVFAAVEIKGKFDFMKTRSVPQQQKPYPVLAEVAKNQPVFEMKNISGKIIGFRCPQFVKGINVPDYHFHFLSDDRTKGGHILDFELQTGYCRIDVCNKLLLLLPEDDSLAGIDLSKDMSGDLQQVESGK